MKNSLLLALLLLPLHLFAQMGQMGPGQGGQMTPEARAKFQTDQWKTDLSLTQSQSDSAFIINLNYNYRMQALRDSIGFDPTSFRTLMEEKDGELKKLFTPDQYNKYQESRRNRQFQPGQGRPGQQ